VFDGELGEVGYSFGGKRARMACATSRGGAAIRDLREGRIRGKAVVDLTT
jgi:hypothetical protein